MRINGKEWSSLNPKDKIERLEEAVKANKKRWRGEM